MSHVICTNVLVHVGSIVNNIRSDPVRCHPRRSPWLRRRLSSHNTRRGASAAAAARYTTTRRSSLHFLRRLAGPAPLTPEAEAEAEEARGSSGGRPWKEYTTADCLCNRSITGGVPSWHAPPCHRCRKTSKREIPSHLRLHWLRFADIVARPLAKKKSEQRQASGAHTISMCTRLYCTTFAERINCKHPTMLEPCCNWTTEAKYCACNVTRSEVVFE